MRFTCYTPLATRLLCMISGAMLLASMPVLAADKDMLSLQRDVADMQGQLTDMQKAVDAKLSALQASVQQALDTANKTSSSVSSLNNGVTQTMQTELRGVKDQLSNVTGLSAKVDGIANDVSDLTSAVKSMQVAMNRMAQQLTDIGNQVKLLSAPPAPPPGSDTGSNVPGAASAPAQPSAPTLFNNAVRDQNSNNLDLAVSGFTQFLHLYPNDPSAMGAQFNLGNIYYSQGKLADAVTAFDAVIEQYDSDPVMTPSSYYMKGMALKKQNKKAAAIATFQDVIKKYRTSPEAGKARTELTTLGATPVAAAKKKP
jgi:TolA-binding protein